MTNAGMVKIAPATSASPTDAAVRATFSSRIVPRKGRSAAMATTAAGKVAETVRPAFIPRYAFAAPSTTAISTPRKTALNVSSLSTKATSIHPVCVQNRRDGGRQLLRIADLQKLIGPVSVALGTEDSGDEELSFGKLPAG